MINYIYFFVFILALIIIDFNVAHWIYLQYKRFELAVETFFFRIRLEFDIFIIRYNKRKYMKMAQEILKDLEKDEQVQP
ncbi:hypothetical protein S-CBP2_0024 [Synechococcus phage S-CBP2]|uniref:Uncharacterized protein n=1 Tax=Synechococcus phage S-CBP2 TaxID=756277 RepID=A0A096VKZ1_9CAUD|nr:hypothetical protein S-CBP2_0024 [Synechococcus phage S-CBP2]AGK86730.1 hypothetical protein S-CBP2_0024 [Synechococcus phage S-CBP2]